MSARIAVGFLGALVAGSATFSGTPEEPPLPTAVASWTLPATELDPRQQAIHALNRLAFGPRPGDVEQVVETGVVAWIERQLEPATIPDEELQARLTPYTTLEMSTVDLLTRSPPPVLIRGISERMRGPLGDAQVDALFPEYARKGGGRNPGRDGGADGRRILTELSQAKLLRAIYSDRQLEEVLTDFWFNHFNVHAGKGADRWWVVSYERDAIRPHVLGSFRELLGAVAEHPAMLFYLDNWLSSADGAAFGHRGLEHYADREIRRLQLPPGGVSTLILRKRGLDTTELERQIAQRSKRRQTMSVAAAGESIPGRTGLNENYARELLELHTLGVDGGYTQQDIVEVARCFTGWTLAPLHAGQGFVFVKELHDRGEKTVLGQRIRARGKAEGDQVLDRLATHPSTARFISTKLARRFVADDPPRALVDRMTRTFLESGGEIREVLRTMVRSSEFWDPAVVHGKVKSPFEFVVSAARVAGWPRRADPGDLPRERGHGPRRLRVRRASPRTAPRPAGARRAALRFRAADRLPRRRRVLGLLGCPAATDEDRRGDGDEPDPRDPDRASADRSGHRRSPRRDRLGDPRPGALAWAAGGDRGSVPAAPGQRGGAIGYPADGRESFTTRDGLAAGQRRIPAEVRG